MSSQLASLTVASVQRTSTTIGTTSKAPLYSLTSDLKYKYCFSPDINSSTELQPVTTFSRPRKILLPDQVVLSSPNENCEQACANLQDTTGFYRCDPRSLRQVNTCEALSDYFECDTCTSEFNSFAPSLRRSMAESLPAVSDGKRRKQRGHCVVSQYQMLLNCDNASEKHQRVCACIRTELR